MFRWAFLDLPEIKYANDLGRRRQDNGETEGRVRKNNAPTDRKTALAYNQMGCRGEHGFYNLNRPIIWHQFKTGNIHGLPDFEDFIDVKTRPKIGRDLIVQLDDNPAWAYVLAWEQHLPWIYIAGWLWGHECMLEKHKKDPTGQNRWAYFVPPPYRHPLDLAIIIRQRRR